MPYNLKDRVKLFKERFPGAKLSSRKLRLLYRKYKISYRKLNTLVYRSEKDLRRDHEQKLEVLPRIIRLMDKRDRICFVDETVFTSK
jgi:hypothetical protein